MKPLTIVVAAFAGVTAAHSVLTVRQGDNKVTAEEICAEYQKKVLIKDPESDEQKYCPSLAEKCIQDQSNKSGGFDQPKKAKEEINLCTFSAMLNLPEPAILSICDEIKSAPKLCHPLISLCVKTEVINAISNSSLDEKEKRTAMRGIRPCVTSIIENGDKNETTVKCKMTSQKVFQVQL
ncbi:hypothetical protein HRG_004044 [Hirsutella rhossiliensis]|uniref:Uncharacterized protein n=1 Tax=Hirsutella rhossiliensis TaxID=111463 RepID=A0A9P8N1Q4_9HYPO|nr:uncharacterized protein HRG_04044 [Hirsutella rhossiliensis]KAH0966028.1 hypothetical protein HRG_04044 [Hirsutella rhossiliensis]